MVERDSARLGTGTAHSLLHEAGGSRPQEPWVFYPDGLDWQWLSMGRAAALIMDLQNQLRNAVGVRPGGWWSFVADPHPATLLLDLALQGLGASVMCAGPSGEAAGHQVIEVPGNSDRRTELADASVELDLADASTVRPPRPWRRTNPPAAVRYLLSHHPLPELAPRDDSQRRQESAVVQEDPPPVYGGAAWGPVPQGTFRRLVSAHPPLVAREVMVFSGDLSRKVDRLAFLWGLEVGAAIAVVRASEVPAAVAWAHPTALWLSADAEDQIERVMEVGGGSSLRARRRLFGRARRAFLVDCEPSAALSRLAQELEIELVVAEAVTDDL